MSRVLAVMVLLTSTACVSDPGTASPRELTIFAASSLASAFRDLGADYEAQHADVDVIFNFGPSDGLAAQIGSEGTADVFASASQTWMDAAADDPGVEGRVDFASNRLVIVTPPDDPAGISSIVDLAGPDVQLILAAEGVPAGDYARAVLANAGIADEALANVVSNEEDNASVVAKVAAGEADVGIVYASDVSVAAGNGLRAVEIPDPLNVVASYPIATIDGSELADDAAAFVDLVMSDEGQATLRGYGFGPPQG